MFELGVPIRIYWDVSPAGEGMLSVCEDICSDIITLKILSLNLSDAGCPVSPVTMRILEMLQGKGIAISLVISPEACTLSLLDRLQELGVRTVLIRASSLAELDTHRHLFYLVSGKPPVGICFEVTHANWRELAALVSFCTENAVPNLSLPMQRLWNGESSFFLEPDEKRQLAEGLSTVAMPDSLKITIHDPFLWKLFYPKVPFPDGGCQAANTMLAISPAGDVYPCPTLPVTLGKVARTSLKDIVASSIKKDVRREILRHPRPCAGCDDLPSCKGGCRGRAYAVYGSLDSIDPGCRT